MSENPVRALCQTFEKVSNSIQFHLSTLIDQPHQPSLASKTPPVSLSSATKVNTSSTESAVPLQTKVKATPITKEELGRATWTFLHTLAAQYPDNPTRQQKKDAKELMAILSRMYPCKECADHFKEILRTNPVEVGSHAEFSQWLCYVHNVVNRSLGKLIFPCERVDARWGKLECEQRECDLLGDTTEFGRGTH